MENMDIEGNVNKKIELDLDMDKLQVTKPVSKTLCFIVLGMAGSGKTTFVKQLEQHMNKTSRSSYLINLDPAVHDPFYEPNLDIRDTINYKQVMQSHNLGPNGSIMTCLNLFATNIHKVVSLLESKKDPLEFVVVDTPGQLEVFSWSASGKLISDSFSVLYPTVLLYVLDLVRCKNPNTFVSNMLYALSIMYKMRLPLVLVMNKADLVNPDYCVSWMKDYEELQNALDKQSDYISSFSRSLCLTLEEFYKTVRNCYVSAKTGEGYEELIKTLEHVGEEYSNEKEKSN